MLPDKEVILRKIKMSISEMVSKEVLESMKVDIDEDFITHIIRVKLSAWLTGEWKEPIVIKQPTSWWQMFKKDVLGARNVKLTVTEIRPSIVYPQLNHETFLRKVGITSYKEEA